jgi:hypothetical protein
MAKRKSDFLEVIEGILILVIILICICTMPEILKVINGDCLATNLEKFSYMIGMLSWCAGIYLLCRCKT